jgi:hypothetical protein
MTTRPGSPEPTAPPPTGRRPSGPAGRYAARPRASELRVVGAFLLIFIVILSGVTAITVALAPPPPEPVCPSPPARCGVPPVEPTIGPVRTRSAAPGTPIPTIIRRLGSPAPGGLASPSGSSAAGPSASGGAVALAGKVGVSANVAGAAPLAASPGASITVTRSASPSASVPGSSASPTELPTQPPTVPPLPAGFPVPRPPSSQDPIDDYSRWTSDELGFTVAYDPGYFEIGDAAPTGVDLVIGSVGVEIIFEGATTDQADPQQLVTFEVDRLSANILGLARITDPAKQPPGHPAIGFIEGVGGVYTGTVNNPQGPAYGVTIAILAATNGTISVATVVITPTKYRDAVFPIAANMLARFKWPTT